MKYIYTCLIIIGLSVSAQAQKAAIVWTKAYEQQVTKEIDESLVKRIPDAVERAKLVNYSVSYFKIRLPRGLESVPQDSLFKISSRIAIDYYTKMGITKQTAQKMFNPQYYKWTPLLENTIKEGFQKLISIADSEVKARVCNCLVLEMKKMYPDSVLLPMPSDSSLKFIQTCKSTLPKK